ncbi:uncharacterized protein B0H18DRAFT_967222 [Fomitopsis serialis]|uniref:uncharacterized protein n=1 Tax=Fomitopsis serialis TaxID=139415 RepID=UPI0020080F4E|nr:uncharacterized protein B0H18DRAFT_967222 [Neoantrodia serialis]KAH9938445.1 hypothetical protein B0H18DRAFT_967222 [Neoantrodia serialis]
MVRFHAPSNSSFTAAAAATNRRLAEAPLRPTLPKPGLPREGDGGKGQAQDKGKARATDKGKGKAIDKGKGRARTPAPMDIGAKEKLKMNMKRKAVLPPNLRRPQWCHLYVGNLVRGITQEMLADFFKKNRCGKVMRVIIRTTSGVPASAHSSLPSSLTDRMYASVEFTDVFAIRRALALNGAKLNGARLTICLTPAELPEIQDIVKTHMGGKAVRALKRITIERTQAVVAVGPPDAPQAGPSRVPRAGLSRAPQAAPRAPKAGPRIPQAGPSKAPQAEPAAHSSPRKSKAQPVPDVVLPPILQKLQVMGVSFAQTIA